MRNIISLLVCLFVVTIFNQPAFGSTSLPIGSEDQFREYALGKVVKGYRYVDSPSMVLVDNKQTWVEVFGNSAEDVLDKLFNTEIVFGLSNTNDVVTGMLWLYSKEGKVLFFGRTDYKVSDLKDGPPSYDIWMQSIPLLEGVLSAKLLALNPDGLTTRVEYLDVENGHLQFPPNLAGVDNGIVVVRFEGNVEISFNLWQSEGQKPGLVTEESQTWQIQSHYVVDSSDSTKVMVKFIETMSAPTVLLKEVKTGQVVVFDCLALTYNDHGQIFERPSEVIITKEDGSMSSAPIFRDGQTSLQLEPGSYRLRFVWPTFQKNRSVYYGPVPGGEGLGSQL